MNTPLHFKGLLTQHAQKCRQPRPELTLLTLTMHLEQHFTCQSALMNLWVITDRHIEQSYGAAKAAVRMNYRVSVGKTVQFIEQYMYSTRLVM